MRYTNNSRLNFSRLSFPHCAPAYKAVYVIYKENHKADYDRDIAYIGQGGERPQDYKNYIICGIGDSEETVAAECEIYGEEARCDGNGTRNKICRVEKVEYEVENYGDNGGEYEHKENLAPVDMIYLYLSLALCKRISYPAYKSGKRHRSCESEIGYHLAVICKGERDYRIEYAENHAESLSYGVALGIEQKRGSADKRRYDGQYPVLAEHNSRACYQH